MIQITVGQRHAESYAFLFVVLFSSIKITDSHNIITRHWFHKFNLEIFIWKSCLFCSLILAFACSVVVCSNNSSFFYLEIYGNYQFLLPVYLVIIRFLWIRCSFHVGATEKAYSILMTWSIFFWVFKLNTK